MLDRLIRWSIDNRFIVVALTLMFVVYGLSMGRAMDVDVLPDFAPPKVEIQTEAPGLAAEEVETLVSLPLESAINQMIAVASVKSISMAGISKLEIVFQEGTNIYRDRQLVLEKLQVVRSLLPAAVGSPMMEPVSSELGDIVKVGLISDRLSLMQLRAVCDFDIRNRLLSVPGVARVVIFGGDQRQFQVLVDADKMRAFAVTLDQLVSAVRACNAVAPAGFVVTADRQFPVHGFMRTNGLADIQESVVTQRAGVPIKIRHVAEVVEGPAFPVGDAIINGRRGVEIIVTKQPGVGTLDVTRRVEKTLHDLVAEHKDISFIPIFQQSDFIRRSIGNMTSAIFIGGGIVVAVLLLFLLNWRTSAVSLAAIPLSLLCALAVIKGFGGSINTMTLGGLAIAVGEVVDDAVVDVENAYRRLRENAVAAVPRPSLSVIFDACREVRSSVVYATFVVALVFVPVFCLRGVEGTLFGQLGLAYVAATVSSLCVALIVTPALSAYLLGSQKSIPRREPALVSKLKRVYAKLLRFVFSRPLSVISLAFILLVGSLGLLPLMGHSFMPEFAEKDLMIPTSAMAGQSLQATSRMGLAVERALGKVNSIAAVGQRVGRAELDDDAAAANFSEFDVRLKDDADVDKTVDEIRALLNQIPGITYDVASFLNDHINDVLSGGTQADLVVKIFGPDVVQLRSLANRMASILRTVPGMVDVTPEQQILIPQVDIRIDRLKAARYGITGSDISAVINNLLDGPVVSQVLDNQRLYGLRIWGRADSRDSLEHISEIPISTADGARLPLSEVATVKMAEGANAIVRENVSRRVTVLANISNKNMLGVVNAARRKLDAQLPLPAGYYAVFSGQYAAQRESSERLAVASLVAFLGIMALLVYGLKGVKPALLVAANLPLAAIGGLVAVFFTGNVLSLGSLIGFISLFGISTRNSLLLVSHINALAHQGMEFKKAVFVGSLDRLAPVLMTALTAALGMLPLAVLGGSGRELEQPLAIVIVGGLVSSTALTLIVIPALYCALGRTVIPEASS